MKTAKEMQIIVDANIQLEISIELDNISRLLLEAESGKKYEISYNKKLLKESIIELESKGYKVDYIQTGNNEYSTIINWKENGKKNY